MKFFKRIIILFLFFCFFLRTEPTLAQEELRFVLAGHIYPSLRYPDLLETFIGQVNELKPDAIFFLGDSVRDGIEEDWKILNQHLSRLESPYYFAPGNHDLQNGRKPKKLWMENVGYLRRSVILGNYKFILLNSDPDLKKYWLNEEEVEFLKAELKDYQDYDQVFLMFHHELWLFPHVNWEEEIYPIIKGKIKAVFAGNSASFSYSQFPGDEEIKYFLTGFPFVTREAKRKPATFLLATAKGGALKVEAFLVKLEVEHPYYQLEPPKEKTFSQKVTDYLQSVKQRINDFGQNLFIVLLGFAFILGFFIRKIAFLYWRFLRKIIKPRESSS